MGSGRDKRKKKAGAKPGGGAEKTAAKTEKKAARRAAAATAAADTDLDALLAEFKTLDAADARVGLDADAGAMPARVYAGCCVVPLAGPPTADAVLFHGGERFDVAGRSETMHTFGDVWVWRPAKGGGGAWARARTAGGAAAAPPPRSGHQAVAVVAGGAAHVYIFGGEVTSRDMERFRHFGDLWRLDPAAWAWERLPSKAGPAARSGHRMVAFKGGLFLFGGFHDDGKVGGGGRGGARGERGRRGACARAAAPRRAPPPPPLPPPPQTTKYFNDVWRYSIADLAWAELSPRGSPPPARGGCQPFLCDDTLFIVGGHTASPDGNAAADRVWDDVWALHGLAAPRALAWARVPKAGFAPPPRAAFGLAPHKRRAILWGGVTDAAGRGDRLYSAAHGDAFQFSADARKWFPVLLRGGAAKATGDGAGAAAPAPAAAEAASTPPPPASAALHAAATRIQARYRGHAVRKAVSALRLGTRGATEMIYSPALVGAAAAAAPRPRARSAPALAVVGDTLLLFGGLVEAAHADATLDDVWSLNLKKLDAWACLRPSDVGEGASGDDGEWGTDSDDDRAASE